MERTERPVSAETKVNSVSRDQQVAGEKSEGAVEETKTAQSQYEEQDDEEFKVHMEAILLNESAASSS